MRNLVKRAARLLLGDYQLNRIYTIDLANLTPSDAPPRLDANQRLTTLEEKDFDSAPDERMRKRRWYGGANAYGFGLWEQDLLVCMCWCWDYRRRAGKVWTLEQDEAALVDIITAESHRGRGLAPIVIQFATEHLRDRGFRRVYAWVWHNHRSSMRSFEKSGWQHVALVAEVELFGWKHLRFARHTRRPGRA